MTYRFGLIAVAVALAATSGAKAADNTAGWDGYYVGVFGGLARFNTNSTDITGEEFGGSTPGSQESVTDNGSLYGLTLGYSMQKGNWVFGPELELGTISGDGLSVVNGDDGVFVDYDGLYASVSGRLGYVVDQTLFYGKAGMAWADITNGGGEFDGVGSEDSGGILGFDGNESGVGEGNRKGFTMGFGVEHALSGNWTVKAEYGFVKFSDVIYIGTTDIDPFEFDDELHTVKVGLNYNF